MSRPIDRLIFVFATGGGLVNAVLDGARKVLSLNGCSLCAITHGLAGEKQEWRSCRAEIGVPIDYLHPEELDETLLEMTEGRLPCVLAAAGEELVLLLEPEVLERCRGSVPDLRGRLKSHAARRHLLLPDV